MFMNECLSLYCRNYFLVFEINKIYELSYSILCFFKQSVDEIIIKEAESSFKNLGVHVLSDVMKDEGFES